MHFCQKKMAHLGAKQDCLGNPKILSQNSPLSTVQSGVSQNMTAFWNTAIEYFANNFVQNIIQNNSNHDVRRPSDVSTSEQNLICLNLRDIFQDFSLSEIVYFSLLYLIIGSWEFTDFGSCLSVYLFLYVYLYLYLYLTFKWFCICIWVRVLCIQQSQWRT